MEGADALSEIPPSVIVDVAVDLVFDAVKLHGVLAVVAIVLSARPFDECDKYEEGPGDDCGGDFWAHVGEVPPVGGSNSVGVLPASSHLR